MPERDIHLLLSQRARKVVMWMLEQMDGYQETDEGAKIAEAIHQDIREQLDEKPRRKRVKK